ncbi:hypothetical protein JVU11DRAFT_8607, partial [Chiua virens]
MPPRQAQSKTNRKGKKGDEGIEEDVPMADRTAKDAGTGAQGGSQHAGTQAGARRTMGIDKYMDEYYDLEEKAREFLIGYARTDLIERNLAFGFYNDRRLNDDESKSLMDSFVCNGLRRFEYDNAINLIIDRDSIETPLTTQMLSRTEMGRVGEGLPELKLKGDDVKTEIHEDKRPIRTVFGPSIRAAGGRHRQHVLSRWVEAKKDALKTRESLRKDLQVLADKGEIAQEDARLQEARGDVDTIRAEIKTGGMWIVAIYDMGKMTDSIGLHLSTNQRLYSYAETAEEGVIQLFKLMQSQDKQWTDVTIESGLRSQKAGYKIRMLLQQEYVWRLLEKIAGTSNTHYTHSDIFKITRLTSDLISEYGGMLATLVVSLEDRLRLCFNTCASWDGEKVRKTMALLEDPTITDQEKEDADKYLNVQLRNLRSETPMASVISDELRGAIDKVYRKTLDKENVWRHFGTQSEVWMNAYRDYVMDVIETMETTYKSTKGRLTDADKDVTTAWETCASKARLVLNIEYTALTPHGLPFMSVGVWHALARQLKRVPSAMVEISSWFSPLVYNQRVIGGRWKIGSASADMIRAITSHPDLRRNHSLLSMNT